jgi:hypothetical protein
MVLGTALAGTANAGDMQVRFDVPAPFRVGSHEYSGGTIAVHSIMAYNPTTSLLQVWVNGDCLGMMTATRSSSGPATRGNEAMFARDDDGRLVMTGYRMAGRPGGTTYRFIETPASPAVEPATVMALGSSHSGY